MSELSSNPFKPFNYLLNQDHPTFRDHPQRGPPRKRARDSVSRDDGVSEFSSASGIMRYGPPLVPSGSIEPYDPKRRTISTQAWAGLGRQPGPDGRAWSIYDEIIPTSERYERCSAGYGGVQLHERVCRMDASPMNTASPMTATTAHLATDLRFVISRDGPMESVTRPQQDGRPLGYRTMPCKHFAKGFCERGNECNFAHIEPSMSTPHNLPHNLPLAVPRANSAQASSMAASDSLTSTVVQKTKNMATNSDVFDVFDVLELPVHRYIPPPGKYLDQYLDLPRSTTCDGLTLEMVGLCVHCLGLIHVGHPSGCENCCGFCGTTEHLGKACSHLYCSKSWYIQTGVGKYLPYDHCQIRPTRREQIVLVGMGIIETPTGSNELIIPKVKVVGGVLVPLDRPVQVRSKSENASVVERVAVLERKVEQLQMDNAQLMDEVRFMHNRLDQLQPNV